MVDNYLACKRYVYLESLTITEADPVHGLEKQAVFIFIQVWGGAGSNLGRARPNLLSIPANVAAASRKPPIWSGLIGGRSDT